jgi:hypothetical protein
MLDRAWELVNSVPYMVSARWLFYRLLQEGYYNSKSDYKDKFEKAISKARKAFYKDWRPDTLADETREAIERGTGYDDVASWLMGVGRARCMLDKWREQPVYLELWFEARAMTDQFQHYTDHITLRPMGGQPSIPYKWEAAKALEDAYERYGVPVVVLYFGDLDTAGGQIADTVESDVRQWCAVDFEFVRCGLTEEQVMRYDILENPEKPGDYQWEALPDMAANEIITGAVSRYLRQDAFSGVMGQERRAERWLTQELAHLPDRWRES